MIVGIEQVTLSPLRTHRVIPKIDTWLIERVRTLGQITPVIVRPIAPNKYEILANAQSWLAVQRAGLHRVEILVREGVNDESARAIVNGNRGSDPLAEAEWFAACIQGEMGDRAFLSIAAFARSQSLSRSYVAHSLRLLTLSPLIQSALRMGALTTGHAKALLSIKNSDQRTQMATSAIECKWSVRKLEAQARSLTTASTEKKPAPKSSTTVVLERRLTDILGSPVSINETSGVLSINYQNDIDVLQGILNRLGYEE